MSSEIRLYTIEEASKLLGVSHRTVSELIAVGLLKSVSVKTDPKAKRGMRRISHGQLRAYIDKLEVEAKFC